MTLPYFCTFVIIPLWRGLNGFPSCKKCLYQVWLKLARCFILKDFFQYTHVKIVSNWRIPLLSPTLTLGDHNYLQYFRKLWSSCKYEFFWLSGSQGKKISMTSPNFHDHHPFEIEEDLTLYLKNFKFPIPKDNLYQVWLKLACWFWRIFFFSI